VIEKVGVEASGQHHAPAAVSPRENSIKIPHFASPDNILSTLVALLRGYKKKKAFLGIAMTLECLCRVLFTMKSCHLIIKPHEIVYIYIASMAPIDRT
jgi:hypothetical protein